MGIHNWKEINESLKGVDREKVKEFSELVNAFNGMVKVFQAFIDENLENQLASDSIATTQVGGLSIWLEKDNSTMIVHQPTDGWHPDTFILPNLKDTLEHHFTTTVKSRVEQLGWTMEQYEELGLDISIKETLSHKLNGVEMDSPIYLIIPKTFNEFSKEQQLFVLTFLIVMGIEMVSCILQKTDLKPKSKPILKS